MTNPHFETSTVGRIAKQLEKDIQNRRLSVGDRYLTANQAAQMLGVSTTTAHRALKLLADQDMVVRQHYRGTFVGPMFKGVQSSQIRTVHVLTPEDNKSQSVLCSHILIEGIRQQLSGSSVQFNFLPSSDPLQYTRELIDAAKAGGIVVGIIAISCPREVYRLLAKSDLPTVILGSMDKGEEALPSIDVDNWEGGRLLTQYLLDRGHRRIALFSQTTWRPGDNAFLDGVNDALFKAQLPCGAMIFRALPMLESAVTAATRELLELPDRPTAIIIRNDQLPKAITSVANCMGLNAPSDVEVVFVDHATWNVDHSAYTHVQPQMSVKDIAQLVSKVLGKVARGTVPSDHRVVIPMELRVGGRDIQQ